LLFTDKVAIPSSKVILFVKNLNYSLISLNRSKLRAK